MIKNTLNKGFTLIELLVVIAVLGVLAAAVVVAINPVQKINQANDSKVKNDVSQIATAEQSYYTVNQYYASSVADLVAAGELTTSPLPPTGYGASYTIAVSPSGCTTASKTCTNVSISGTLKAPSVVSNTLWCFKTSTGVSGEGTACAAP
jgi:prepilin-type N-terminal cleavage/methylation domain-containing protein